MPYRRKYKKKSYRPGYVACGKMVLGDAAKALKMASYLKSIVNVEFKNHDTNVQEVISTTASITQLTNIAQGDTTVTRDGSSCKIVSLMLNYFITMHASAIESIMRVIVVHDRQTNQAIYAAADLLHDTSINDALNSPKNLDNDRRFSILYDRCHSLSSAGTTIKNFKFYRKLALRIRYDNAAAAITSLTQNSLSIFLISNEATNTPSINFFLRLRFVDN